MIGMNAIIHLGTAVGLLGLIWWLLEMQKQRDLMRRILKEVVGNGASPPQPIRLGEPLTVMRQLSNALGVPFEMSSSLKLPVTKYNLKLISETILVTGCNLIEWSENKDHNKQVVVRLHVPSEYKNTALARVDSLNQEHALGAASMFSIEDS